MVDFSRFYLRSNLQWKPCRYCTIFPPITIIINWRHRLVFLSCFQTNFYSLSASTILKRSERWEGFRFKPEIFILLYNSSPRWRLPIIIDISFLKNHRHETMKQNYSWTRHEDFLTMNAAVCLLWVILALLPECLAAAGPFSPHKVSKNCIGIKIFPRFFIRLNTFESIDPGYF